MNRKHGFGHTKIQKTKFLSLVLHKNSPQTKNLKIIPPTPQYQKVHQNMQIIHPNAEHGFAALVNDNILSIFKTLPFDFKIF